MFRTRVPDWSILVDFGLHLVSPDDVAIVTDLVSCVVGNRLATSCRITAAAFDDIGANCVTERRYSITSCPSWCEQHDTLLIYAGNRTEYMVPADLQQLIAIKSTYKPTRAE